jgi:hypothetical protein
MQTQQQAPTSWKRRFVPDGWEFASSSCLRRRQNEWAVLTSDDLRKSMQGQVEEVAGVLDVSQEVASLLLRTFGYADRLAVFMVRMSCVRADGTRRSLFRVLWKIRPKC